MFLFIHCLCVIEEMLETNHKLSVICDSDGGHHHFWSLFIRNNVMIQLVATVRGLTLGCFDP